MSILIRNAQVLDAKTADIKSADIAIYQGAITAIGDTPSDFQPQRVIEANGLLAIPGLVDLGVYLRDPGFEYKATIYSETKAAAAAGVTTLCCMPDTQPVTDLPTTVELVQRRAHEASFCKVLTIGALTRGLQGKELSDMAALKEAGCVAVSNCLYPFSNTMVLRRAMEYATGLDLPLFVHPFDTALAGDGCAHEGPVALRLGLSGITPSAEVAFLSQCLALAEDIGAKVHFCRLSCARSVELIAEAQARGLLITADVSAHQLFLTERMLESFDPNYHVLPPLRSEDDRATLRAAVKNNTVTAICSDHQPHDINAKLAPFPATEPGISSIETLLPLTLRLVEEGVINLSQAIYLLTEGPATVLGWGCGKLTEGGVADICLVDLNEVWTVSAQTLCSSGTNTPWLEEQFKGRVRYTVCNGQISYEANK